MSALLELAERCEAATGLDRDALLDLEVAIRGVVRKLGVDLPVNQPFTASVDAALTLVPEDFRFYVDNGTLDGGSCHACVYAPGDGFNPPSSQGGCKDAATPALAICAAALRARAAQ